MFNGFIRQITQLFAKRSPNCSQAPISRANSTPHRNSPKSNGSYAPGFNSDRRPHSNGDGRHRASQVGHCHNAERLLRDGYFRIAIAGFNDTAFNISAMARHDAPRLAEAVSDLPCNIKMVARRNIAAGLQTAINTLDDGIPGRRGIVLITSGDTAAGQSELQILAEKAARLKVGIHVICLGAKSDDLTGGPRINTHSTLGYGKFRMVGNADSLLAAIRDAFQGLTPAFGMRGTNKAMVLLDCSETMVEAYRATTRINLVIAALQEFLNAPLVRNAVDETGVRKLSSGRLLLRRKSTTWKSHSALETVGASDWSPGSH